MTRRTACCLTSLLLLCGLATHSMAAQEPNPDELAAKGALLSQADPVASELRMRQANDAARRGFDIGMATAEGHTAPGPGKDKFRDTLPLDERAGWNTAVAYSVERNRLATAGKKLPDGFGDLVVRGAAIARLDPIVAVGRALMESDIVYWFGFDLATGIFGDPALGANGNTLLGPGATNLRNFLSPAGQRGFDAGVALHLSRSYKKP